MQECTFTPAINRTVDYEESFISGTDRLYGLSKVLKRDREMQIKTHEESKYAHLNFTPVLNKRSEHMVGKYDRQPLHERVVS